MSYPSIASSINIKQLGNAYHTRKNLWYVANIPLSIIDFCNWEPTRYKNSMELIKNTQSVKPIILGSFDDDIQKYTLIDGNHRCFCCNELGYTYIPSIVNHKNKDTRFIKID
jgi:hypothetical protein